ncbi:MAG: 2-amino-4-hydroxy-6-hydroxymethyldihydropteridine diphosphokinase [Methylococcales bacterium]|mgnify:CR=1 FL=1|jgi:2-amino-4-hydroxy-6-hydroxymethyldihydropteridine diphosphokinase|nr:2-amino-4-hydroxy-6-hydroxymethyldihydropteridine diphosphokinase [Methylococcales bacterium]MBT7446053.1 2-amino-4-hydroxy-6-hydroxymethyldihydropteridine diphosphokinase [Methylococcales bacterium]
MNQVYISIGSNLDRSRYINQAVQSLDELFAPMDISPVYESEAFGFEGDDFYNLVVAFKTDLPLEKLHQTLRQIEDANGRDRTAPKFSARTLDLDILTFGEHINHQKPFDVPRDEITKMAFVLKPLFDIAADAIHPELNQSYQTLWQAYDQTKQPLTLIEFQYT